MTAITIIVALFFVVSSFVNAHEATEDLKGVDKYIAFSKNILWRSVPAFIAFMIISHYLNQINLTSEIIKTTENTPTFFRSIFDNLGNLAVIGIVFWVWNVMNEVEGNLARKKLINTIKKLFLLTLLLSSAAFAEDRYETNVPDIYIKNFQCIDRYPKFNIVNKTDKTITQLSMHIFDSDGDPIDKRTRNLIVTPQSGKEDGMGGVDCKNLKKIGFSVIVY